MSSDARSGIVDSHASWLIASVLSGLTALGVVAAGALVAALEADQGGFTAFRALPWARQRLRGERTRAVGAGQVDDFGVGGAVHALARQKPDLHHVAFNHVAAVIMPLVGGVLWTTLGYQWVFYLGAIAAAGSVIAAHFVPKREPEHKAPPVSPT